MVSKKRFLTNLTSLLCFFLFVSACENVHPPKEAIERENKTKVKQAKASKQVTKQLAPNHLELREKVKQTSLVERWHYSLEESIRHMYMVGDLLLIETENQKLIALDRRDGMPQWVYHIGTPIDFPPTLHEESIYILSLSKLHVVAKSTGGLLFSQELNFVPSSAVCATDKHLFVGSLDNFLYALNLKDIKDLKKGYRDWRYRMGGYAQGTPLELEGNLYTPNTDGLVYAINANQGSSLKNWGDNGKFSTLGENVASIVGTATPPVVYVGSRDYNLYSLDRISGFLNWKFESGGEITRAANVIGSSVYAVSDRNLGKSTVFYAIDNENGNEKWSLVDGRQLYFQGKYNLWVIMKDSKVVAVNPESGTITDTCDFSGLDHFVTNLSDDHGFIGYMATSEGSIFAVEEK